MKCVFIGTFCVYTVLLICDCLFYVKVNKYFKKIACVCVCARSIQEADFRMKLADLAEDRPPRRPSLVSPGNDNAFNNAGEDIYSISPVLYLFVLFSSLNHRGSVM